MSREILLEIAAKAFNPAGVQDFEKKLNAYGEDYARDYLYGKIDFYRDDLDATDDEVKLYDEWLTILSSLSFEA